MRSKIPRTIESFVSRWSSIIPQASDEANYGIWGYLGAISLYIAYAVLKDVRNSSCLIENHCCDKETQSEIECQSQEVHPGQFPKNNHVGSFETDTQRVHIVRMTDEQWFAYRRWRDMKSRYQPQSEEVPTTHRDTQEIAMGMGEGTEQNVKFIDTHPGYVLEEKSNFDPLRDHALESDASLDEFFSRPIKIASYDWAVGSSIHQRFNPWSLYFENPRVINRISNYKLMRSKLHVKVTISGNGFHYGRAVMSYNPLPELDEMTVDRAFVDADFIAASQRPHVYLDPTNSQGGELLLPFFYHKNVIDITDDGWSELGEMVINDIQTLKHANGATDEVTINVFAWAVDPKFAIPTQKEPSTITAQAAEVEPQAGDEYDKKGEGAISRAAGVIAAAAGKLTTIPPIAPFAKATEIGASAAGALATLFGYSRPAMLESCQYRPNTKSNFAVTNVSDDVVKLSVDAKQELSIDPRTVGLDNVDELGINYIAGRESYLVNFPWTLGTASETLLWNAVVDPGVMRTNSGEYHLPACAFACMPFRYWRGSMKYRFQVVCSKYHKGRLKIVYDPAETPSSGNAEYNTAYTTIIDIADTTDFTIDIGWGQETTYREHWDFGSVSTTIMQNTSRLAYDSSVTTVGNGTISVYVVNELTVPNTTANNDIAINVFVSAGPDFEVAVPTMKNLRRMRTTTDTVLTAPEALEVEPQAAEDENDGDETERMDSKPHHSPVVNTMAAKTSLTDKTNLVHFGEHIRSMRQLLKRYNVYDLIRSKDNGETDGVDQIITMSRDSFPWEGGYTAAGGDHTYTLVSGFYKYSNMTFHRYLTLGYAGWRGGFRWVYDFSTFNDIGQRRLPSVFVGNSTSSTTSDTNTLSFDQRLDNTLPVGMADHLADMQDMEGHDGYTFQACEVNPTVSFEVPYYSQYRFSPAKARCDWSGAKTIGMPEYWMKIWCEKGTGTEAIISHCAAAEDFSCYFYLGPPVLYDGGLGFPS
jgi:hypothetical protein